jgi:alpha-beta hydrolase superfamily lysophospholipase
VALDAPPADGVWPLVVISHGNSGTPWAYRQLAKHLVLAGFVVALPAHTGNTRLDNSLAGTAANLANRPRHLTLAIDAVLAEPRLVRTSPRGGVAVIGHSIGGYTALAAAGGLAWSGPRESKDGQPAPVPVTPDARIRSLVLLNPATFWFIDGSLRKRCACPSCCAPAKRMRSRRSNTHTKSSTAWPIRRWSNIRTSPAPATSPS